MMGECVLNHIIGRYVVDVNIRLTAYRTLVRRLQAGEGTSTPGLLDELIKLGEVEVAPPHEFPGLGDK